MQFGYNSHISIHGDFKVMWGQASVQKVGCVSYSPSSAPANTEHTDG